MLACSKSLVVSLVAMVLIIAFANESKADEMVGKLKGINPNANVMGKHRVVISLQISNGQTAMFSLQNKDDNAPKPTPDDAIVSTLKTFKNNDLVKVSYNQDPASKQMTVTKIDTYNLKPGEDEPNAYIFHESYEKKISKTSYIFVDLRKFGQPLTAVLPMHKDKNGDPEADPALQSAVSALKDGDIMLADLTPGRPLEPGKDAPAIIKHVELYTAPQQGKLVKIDDKADLNGNKTTSADIDADGKTITVFVPGTLDGKKWTVDSKLTGALKKLKPESEVMFRASDENGKSILHAIAPAPKVPSTGKPADKDKMTKPGDKPAPK